MSLYYVQKFLFELNRTPELQERYRAEPLDVLGPYELTEEEVAALVEPDIGLLFHLGVNGQILMHFAAFHQIEWADYLQRMRDGIDEHGPVREGVYALTGYDGVDAPDPKCVATVPGDSADCPRNEDEPMGRPEKTATLPGEERAGKAGQSTSGKCVATVPDTDATHFDGTDGGVG